MRICESCGSNNPADSQFCGKCGTSFVATELPPPSFATVELIYCGICGARNLADAQICTACSSRLSQGEAFTVTTATSDSGRVPVATPVAQTRPPVGKQQILAGVAITLLLIVGGLGFWRLATPSVAAGDEAQVSRTLVTRATPIDPTIATPGSNILKVTQVPAQALLKSTPTDEIQPTTSAPTPTENSQSTIPEPTQTLTLTPERVFGPEIQQNPVQVSASSNASASVDDRGNQTTFIPENAIDGRPDTTWRVAGDGRGAMLEFRFAGPVLIREIQLIPGYAKRDPATGTDRFMQNRRVLKVRFEFSDGSNQEASFVEEPRLQAVAVDQVLTSFVRIVVLETSQPGANDGRDFTPISEVVVIGKAVQ